jgi:hypothetical protein
MTDKTVSHAIERGIYFLFANRRFCGNEPRGRQPLDCGYGQQPVRSLRAPETVQRHPSSGGRGHFVLSSTVMDSIDETGNNFSAGTPLPLQPIGTFERDRLPLALDIIDIP